MSGKLFPIKITKIAIPSVAFDKPNKQFLLLALTFRLLLPPIATDCHALCISLIASQKRLILSVYYFSFIKLKVSTFLVYKVKKCLLKSGKVIQKRS